MATAEEANEFARKMGAVQPFICDQARWVYQNFGLKAGSMGQMFSLRTIARGMRASRRGHRVGTPVGDPMQLAGTFVIARDGEIAWEHRATDASDNATAKEILDAVAGIDPAEG